MAAFWALITPALWKLLPTFLSIFSGMLIKVFESAKPLVHEAAARQSLPTGAERHDWVVNHVIPIATQAAQEGATALLDPIQLGVANIGVYLAYKAEQSKLPKGGTIPPIS